MLVRESLVQVSELRGGYPNIALPPGMREEFGADAMFVTLPIGKVGARSRNERTYSEAAVKAIVDAVNTMRPEGRWGHLRDEERPYTYGPPAIRWLVAMIDSEGIAWAKGFPTTSEAREYFRVAKIAGSRVGTSVYGFGRMDGDQVVDFELESIDLAAPDRVGIPETAAEPMITKETEDNGMTEITLRDVPDAVRQQILEQYSNEQNGARLSEMEQQVATLSEQVQALTTERDAARGEASKLLATYVQARIAEQVQLAPVRKLIARMVGIKESGEGVTIAGISTMAEADEALTAALADEDVKVFNQQAVGEMMGPDWQPPASGGNNDNPVLGAPIPG